MFTIYNIGLYGGRGGEWGGKQVVRFIKNQVIFNQFKTLLLYNIVLSPEHNYLSANWNVWLQCWSIGQALEWWNYIYAFTIDIVETMKNAIIYLSIFLSLLKRINLGLLGLSSIHFPLVHSFVYLVSMCKYFNSVSNRVTRTTVYIIISVLHNLIILQCSQRYYYFI